jgi:hypothetical protein
MSFSLRRPGALLSAVAGAATLVALFGVDASASTTAAAPVTFTWTGTDSAAGTNSNWSDGGNWQGGVAPTSSAPVSLVFPALSCQAKEPCGQVSVNDIAGMVVDRLTIVTSTVTGSGPVPPNYVISGDGVTITGGIRATGQKTTRFPTAPALNMPVRLRGDQTWFFDRTSFYLNDLVSGGSSSLVTYLGHGADVLLMGGAHLGGLAMVGTNAADAGVDSGHNGQIYVPTDQPFTVSGAVSVMDASAYFMGHFGSLATGGSQLPIGGSGPPNEGILSTAGGIAFDSASNLQITGLFMDGSSSPQPGVDYPQIQAGGRVALKGIPTVISAGCAQTRGIVYTLVTAKGGLSGTLSEYVNGTVTPIPQGGVIETVPNDDDGSCEGPPPQWVQIHYDDQAGTVTATTVAGP